MKEFNEAIIEYYKLKKRYEDSIDKLKKQILNQPISNRAKRKAFLELNPQCVICKQPGGTNFSSTYNSSKTSRELKAKCNSKTQCKLNINILVGNYHRLDTTTYDLKHDLEEDKKEVIKTKNNQLFGLQRVDDTLDVFNKLKADITDSTDLYITYVDELNDKINNKEQNEDLSRNQEIFYDIVNNIKFLVNEYNNTNNVQFINDLINTYKNQLLPLITKIRNLKYKLTGVGYNKDDNQYTLIQQKHTINELEINLGENKIISFIVN